MAAPKLQTAGPGNIDETLTLSMQNLLPGIRDNVFQSNVLLKWLNSKGIKRRGGASLSHGELYQTNSTAQAYQRYDILNVTPQNGLTRDQWLWRQYSVSVSVDGFSERIANAGQFKIEDVVETKKFQAEEGLSLLLEQEIFAAAPGTKSLRSLPVLILDSGTEGDINGGTNTWWQSLVTASGSWAAQGRTDITALYNTLTVRNPTGGPELFISDQASLEFYEGSLTPQVRFSDTKMADIGIRNLLFKDTPWTFSPQATAGVVYALHSKGSNPGIQFIINSDSDFQITPFVKPADQDARVSQILFAGALVTGNRRKLGKLTNIVA